MRVRPLPMQTLRTIIRDHRRLVVMLIVLVLCVKMLVPAGFMIDASGKSLAVTMCDGQGPEQMPRMGMAAMEKAPAKTGKQGNAPDTCPYSGLAMGAMSSALPALLVFALAFILTRGFWPDVGAQPVTRRFLRPPLRGPPLPG